MELASLGSIRRYTSKRYMSRREYST